MSDELGNSPSQKSSNNFSFSKFSLTKNAKRNIVIGTALVLCVLIAILAIFKPFGLFRNSEKSSKAAIVGGYPKLGLWWPDKSYPMSIPDIAKHDWVILEDWSKASVDKIHLANANTKVLNSSNAAELRYNPNAGPTDAMNFEFAAASPQWVLTQLGTTINGSLSATATTIPVTDSTRFIVNDMVICENEVMYVRSVGTGSITVTRDWLKAPVAHASGVRIAPAFEQWPGSVTMDLTDRCPQVDVGHGLENWASYNARIGNNLTTTASWDGLYVDVSNGNKSTSTWNSGGTHHRSIDYFRNNIAVSSYATFDAAWNTGLTSYQSQLRTLLSTKVIFTNGSYPNFALMNGTAFEQFPETAGSQYGVPWNTVMFGPLDRGSVTDWMTKSGTPNLTTLLTYGDDTGSGTTVDYRKMRFGLTSALLQGAHYNYTQNQHLLGAAPLPWFDEYDNAGAGKGYLGQPTAGPYQVTTGGAWRRDFDNGIVLTNPTNAALTVSLGGNFRKIKGTQVPTLNDGTLVSSVTIQPLDGIILLREVTPVVTVDTTPPVVSFSTPSNNATVTGSVTLTANATDNIGVTKVEFFADNTTIGVSTGAPFSVVWDSSKVSAGSHVLKVTAADAAGNSASSTVTVTVQAVVITPPPAPVTPPVTPPVVTADTVPPTTTLVSPYAGQVLQKTNSIKVSTSDASGIQKVDYYIDNTLVGTITYPNSSGYYAYSWNTKNFSNGAHTVKVVSYDNSAAHNSSSVSVSVTVKNSWWTRFFGF